MPRCAASSATRARSSSLISAPVGLPGELMTMPRVRGVNAAMSVSACSRKPSSARVRTMTGVASASLICSTSVGQPGMCVITSSPVAEQAERGVVERLLAACGDDRLGRGVVDAVVGLVAGADRALQLVGARVRRVLREVGVDGGVGRLVDVPGRRKIRLAGAEVDHVDPLGLEAHGLGRHLHRGRNADPRGPFCKHQVLRPQGVARQLSSRAAVPRQGRARAPTPSRRARRLPSPGAS